MFDAESNPTCTNDRTQQTQFAIMLTIAVISAVFKAATKALRVFHQGQFAFSQSFHDNREKQQQKCGRVMLFEVFISDGDVVELFFRPCLAQWTNPKPNLGCVFQVGRRSVLVLHIFSYLDLNSFTMGWVRFK